MKNNPIREMVEAIERVAVDYPQEKPLMIGSTWNLLTDIVDGSEAEIDGLNTHSENDYRQIITQIHNEADPIEAQALRDLYMDGDVDDPDKALRYLRHVADMIDILYDMYGGRCDIDPHHSMPDEPDDLDEYTVVWTVTPDPDTYTVGEHGICVYDNRTHTFHVKDDVVTLPLEA
jgi:hypothetical protein